MLKKIDYEKVTDNALKYGYDSPTAFNRAFQITYVNFKKYLLFYCQFEYNVSIIMLKILTHPWT